MKNMPPEKSLEGLEIRFDYLPASPLENGWFKAYNTDAVPTFSIPAQGAMSMQTGGKVFAIDYPVPPSAKDFTHVNFRGSFQQGAIFYTEIEVAKDKGSSEVENWWFAHVVGGKNLAPEKDPNGREWKFHIFPGDGKNQFDLDLRKEVAQGLGGKTYRGIRRIRVRGDIVLWPIRLSNESSIAPVRRSLASWKSWSLTDKLTAIGVIIAFITIIVTIYLPELRIRLGLDKPKQESVSTPAPPQSQPEPKPVQGLDAKRLVADTAPNIQEMRRRDHVSLISEIESEKTTAEVPPDSFGFTAPPDMLYDRPKTLYRSYGSRGFEIHKLHDGSLIFLAYSGPETFERLREGVRKGEDVTLYSNPWRGATKLVALPLDRFKCGRDRLIHMVAALDCKILD